ncbi:hypothetical protein HK105_201380 [Polyrhizophydium stewartii]|uniref:Uncharacterized protein n=1 Tax=Polyrhizophydium stewartii TaxID=2732419 RepID=A0ABR4NI18_9FUNG
MKSLTTLFLDRNKFTGTILDFLGRPTELGKLTLACKPCIISLNNLAMSILIPSWIGNLKRLTFLNLGTSGYTDPIPD